MKLSIVFNGVCRDKQFVSFLECCFRDAVLNYEPDPSKIKRLLAHDKWERPQIWRRGRDAIRRHLTAKEMQNIRIDIITGE